MDYCHFTTSAILYSGLIRQKACFWSYEVLVLGHETSFTPFTVLKQWINHSRCSESNGRTASLARAG